MWFRSSKSAATSVVEITAENRRRHPRHKLRSLTYVTFDSAQRGIVRDLSESGIAAQTVPPLAPNENVHLRLDLQNPRTRIEGEGRVTWTDSLGQAGVEIIEMPSRARRGLKDWLLTQILADAQRVGNNEDCDLLFSNDPRPVIRLGHAGVRLVRPQLQKARSQDFHFLGLSVPSHKFSWFVDALVLLCATLLFHVVALLMTDTLPVWWLASAFVLAVTGILGLAYWLLFAVCIGATPGHRLAQLAGLEPTESAVLPEKESVRFR